MDKKLKVLIAEDNEINMKYAKKILEKKGFEVVGAENGKEALRKFSEEAFDIILMDIQMPVLNGLDVIKIIREIEKDQEKRTKIIVFSAFVQREEKEKFMRAGADVFIAKPVNSDELYNRVVSIWSNEYTENIKELSEPVIIDGLNELLKILDNKKNDLEELMEIFWRDCERRRQQILSLAESKNYELLGNEIHSLKTGINTLRQEMIAETAHVIERMCREKGNLDFMGEQLKRLFQEIELFKITWEKYTTEL